MDINWDILSLECSQNVLLDLAKVCIQWKLIGKRLGLTKADINTVEGDYHSVEEKRVWMLEKWKDKFTFKATYHAFIKALLADEKSTDATDATKIIKEFEGTITIFRFALCNDRATCM